MEPGDDSDTPHAVTIRAYIESEIVRLGLLRSHARERFTVEIAALDGGIEAYHDVLREMDKHHELDTASDLHQRSLGGRDGSESPGPR